MSVALGQDTTTSAMQLGKALNDPIKGMTALRRVGVTFTEAQEKQIKKLQESGDTMGAQKIILRELRDEFGGSAKAAGETFGGQINILRERFNNWAGDMVGKAIPMLKRLFEWFNDKIVPVVSHVAEEIMPLLRSAIGSIADTIRENEPELREMWENISTAVKQMWKVVGPILKFFFEEIVPRYINLAIKYIGWWIKGWLAVIDTTKRIVKWFTGTFWPFWKNLWEDIVDVWDGVKTAFTRFTLWMQERALRLVLNILEPFSHLPGKMGKWARDAKDRINPELDKVLKKIEAIDRAARRRPGRSTTSGSSRTRPR